SRPAELSDWLSSQAPSVSGTRTSLRERAAGSGRSARGYGTHGFAASDTRNNGRNGRTIAGYWAPSSRDVGKWMFDTCPPEGSLAQPDPAYHRDTTNARYRRSQNRVGEWGRYPVLSPSSDCPRLGRERV